MNLAERSTMHRRAGHKALVAFLTAGYPSEEDCAESAIAAARAGCDLIELGVPFSDPIADGPVIQASSTAALARGMSLARCLDLAAAIARHVDKPVLLMSYINPILRFGAERFVARAHDGGVAGLLVPDLPLEESMHLRSLARRASLDYVDFVAPTSTQARIAAIAAQATAFIYLVSVAGVTGSLEASARQVQPLVARVRARTHVPVYVGFGVSTAERAAAVCRVADGVILGSRLVRLLDEARRDGASPAARVGEFLSTVRHAIDHAEPGGVDAGVERQAQAAHPNPNPTRVPSRRSLP